MTVFDLKAGESAKIAHITISGGARSRLDALGIREGERITALSFSLFKSSVLITCKAVRVGLRKNLAKKIAVEK